MRPASSIAFRIPYAAANPPPIPSDRTTSLVSTPCRSRSWRIWAVARSVGVIGASPAASVRDQRPATSSRTVKRSRRREQRAHRVEAVIRDLAGPDEIPERVAELWCEAAARCCEKVREERRTARVEDLAEAVVDRAIRSCFRRRHERAFELRDRVEKGGLSAFG